MNRQDVFQTGPEQIYTIEPSEVMEVIAHPVAHNDPNASLLYVSSQVAPISDKITETENFPEYDEDTRRLWYSKDSQK